MDAVSVQFDHIHVVAAVRVALLVLDDDEEWIRGYGVRSAHGGAKIRNLMLQKQVDSVN